MFFFHTLKINATKTTLDHTDVTQSFVPQRKEQKSPYFCLTSLCVLHCVLQEEVRAQMPRYQCKVPSAGQAHVTSPPVAPMGGVLPPQQGIPAQQPGVRHPMQGRVHLRAFRLFEWPPVFKIREETFYTTV